MSIATTIVEQLKKFAKVLVYVGERASMNEKSISVNPVKLDELVSTFGKIYASTHTVSRNLPKPPDCEAVFVMVWIIASDFL